MRLSKEYSPDANFSIIMPGGCNASCDFCFWKESDCVSPLYIQHLRWHLERLVLIGAVTQVSITGGEPTMSPIFDDVINMLRDFDLKVVLTTNGFNLTEKLPLLNGCVNHVNISRHHSDDIENYKIFGTDPFETDGGFMATCSRLNQDGIDVTLCSVVQPDCGMGFVEEMVEMCKHVGASALTLRVDYRCGIVDKIGAEEIMSTPSHVGSCPVCETRSYFVSGIRVNVKTSIAEPSEGIDYIYEFVYHPDGRLTEDWAGEKSIVYTSARVRIDLPKYKRPTINCHPVPNRGGCGRGGC